MGYIALNGIDSTVAGQPLRVEPGDIVPDALVAIAPWLVEQWEIAPEPAFVLFRAFMREHGVGNIAVARQLFLALPVEDARALAPELYALMAREPLPVPEAEAAEAAVGVPVRARKRKGVSDGPDAQ